MSTDETAGDVVVIVGAGVLGAWVSDFIRQAYSLSERTTEVHLPDSDWLPDEIGRPRGGEVPRVTLVVEPGRQLMDLLRARALPVVAVLDDPVDSVRHAMASQNIDFFEAMRRQSRRAMAHHLLFENGAVLLVGRGTPKPARSILGSIMGHLGLRVRAEEEAALLERCAGPEEELLSLEEALATRVPHYARLDRLSELVPAEDAAIVRQALSPLIHAAVSRDIGPITWATRTLMFGDDPGTPAPPVADIMGGARILFYGPYYVLPPGDWSVRMVLAFSEEARGVPFRLTVFAADRPIAKVALRPMAAGAFEGVFTARHVDAHNAIEIHFTVDEASIEGHVALGQLTFTRTGTVSAIDYRDE